MDAQDWQDRLHEKLRELGTEDPQCGNPECDERNPFALTGAWPDILCYECRAVGQGRSWTEGDHYFGQHNDPAKDAIPGNDHRLRTERQYEWPRETLRNPKASPLRWAAAGARATGEYLGIVLERYVSGVPEFLEALDAWLADVIGPEWMERFKNETGWRKP